MRLIRGNKGLGPVGVRFCDKPGAAKSISWETNYCSLEEAAAASQLVFGLPPRDLDSLPSWQLQHERRAKPHAGPDMQNCSKNKGVMDCWPEPGRRIATRISLKIRRPVKGIPNKRQNQKQLELLEISKHYRSVSAPRSQERTNIQICLSRERIEQGSNIVILPWAYLCLTADCEDE